MRPHFDRAAFWLFAALVVLAPVPLGSNRPWAWSMLEMGVFGAGLLWLAGYARHEVRASLAVRAALPALFLLALWLLFLLLQWMPLPRELVRVLSPRAAELYAAVDYIRDGGSITLSSPPFDEKQEAERVAEALNALPPPADDVLPPLATTTSTTAATGGGGGGTPCGASCN